MSLYVGLMSGTSMDGIDAALVDLPSNTLVLGQTKRYSPELKDKIEQLATKQSADLATICQINHLIGKEFAQATIELLQEAKCPVTEIEAIGSHGQTLSHDTSAEIPYTMQLGCGHTISALTGATVIADFRTRDIVNGGQGAPFAPLYHQELFMKNNQPVAVVNIGGIANISFIKPNEPARGWDVGPGNCLMDAWIQQQLGKSFDADGSWAKEGRIITELLTKLLKDPFLAEPAPKSLGKEYYSSQWLNQHLNKAYSPVDVQSTLVAYTAHAIANTVLLQPQIAIKELYLCGGGAHNKQLLNTLSSLLPGIKVLSSAEQGVNPDFLEAMMFAWLASKTLNSEPVNLSPITGSNGPQILGAIYPVLKSTK